MLEEKLEITIGAAEPYSTESKGNFHETIFSKVVFGFAECQEIGT